MSFPSKKDLWMTIILWLFAVLFIIPPIFFPDVGVWMTPSLFDKQWIKIATLSSIGLFLLSFWFNTVYIIADNLLIIRYGPFTKKIKIADIHRVRETRNLFSAPALSMDKLEISYGKFEVIAVSPKDRDEFIRLLANENPAIKWEIKKEN